ncbi:MAG: TcpQ domain-containing protein, partial [Burkholderiales bacterium]
MQFTLKYISIAFIAIRFFPVAVAGNLIDDPRLLYQAPATSKGILEQKITINRKFNNIDELVERINFIDGLSAQVTYQSATKPTPVTLNLANTSISKLLDKAVPKLGYSWSLDNNVVILTALHPLHSPTVSYTETNKPTASAIVVTSLSPRLPIAVQATWTLDPQDRMLRNALTRWCNQTKWQLVWNVKVDYPIT